MFKGFPLIPEQASTYARGIDTLYYGLVVFSLFFTILIFLLILWLAIRYRRRHGHEVPTRSVIDLRLEVAWTLGPFAIAVGLLVWGVVLFLGLQRPPPDALEIQVVGKQWMWKLQHPSGHREINELHVPVNRPIRLTMASQDVIHSFFVPAFRVKQDVLPGRYTTLWFEATRTGRYHLFCAEYCGTEHSLMGGWVEVMTPADYQRWLSGGAPPASPAAAGARLFEQHACDTCHRTGPGQRGPSLQGLYGQLVELDGGGTVVADEQYIRESILDPRAKVVAGYRPLMPTFRGRLSEEQILELLAFIRSLGGAPPGERSQ